MHETLQLILSFTLTIIGLGLVILVFDRSQRNRYRQNYQRAKDMGADLSKVRNPDSVVSVIPEGVRNIFKALWYVSLSITIAIVVLKSTKGHLEDIFPFSDIVKLTVVSLIFLVLLLIVLWGYRKLIQSFGITRLDPDSGLIKVIDDKKPDVKDNKGVYLKIFILILVALSQIWLWDLAYDSGYEDGYQDGDYWGHRRGYDEGFYEGEKKGYDEGYDDGKELCGL